MPEKNQQFIEQQRASDLQQTRNQARFTAPRQNVKPAPGEAVPIDIATSRERAEIKPAEEQEEEYLDDWNQTRAAETQVIPMPEKPRVPFPWLALVISLANDILDVLELTGIGMAATKAIDIIFGIIRFLGKIATPGKTGWGSLIGTWIIEMIPGMGLLPTWTIQCIYNWLQEKKIAEQSYQQAVEETKLQAANLVADEE